MMFQSYYNSGNALPGCASFVRVTLGETQTSYVYLFEVPGAKADTIEVMLQGQCLLIKGNCTPLNEKGFELMQTERLCGPFQRSVMLPSLIDPDKISAKLEDGILEVTLPKRMQTQAPFKKITINKGTSK